MVTSSRGGDSSSSRSKDKEFFASISWKVSQLKKQVQAARSVSIRDKILKNRKNLEANTRRIFELSKEKEVAREAAESGNLLSVRLADPLCLLSAWEPDKEIASIQEEIAASASIMFGSSCGRKSLVCLTKLPFVEKIPPYTTWIFLNRNQRMTEDQSVLGRRQIYYDPYGNETLICSDSEEEFVEPEDEKHEFSEGEDWILWVRQAGGYPGA